MLFKDHLVVFITQTDFSSTLRYLVTSIIRLLWKSFFLIETLFVRNKYNPRVGGGVQCAGAVDGPRHGAAGCRPLNLLPREAVHSSEAPSAAGGPVWRMLLSDCIRGGLMCKNK